MTIRSTALAALLAALAPTMAHADLLGETLTFQRLYPNASTAYGNLFTPQTVTVVAGDADNASWGNNSIVYTVIAPEALTITLNFLVGSGSIGAGSVFDGYAISGFSFSPAGAQLVANTTGQTVELSFTEDTVFLDLDGNYNAGVITLDFTQAVPEPGTWALFGAGIAALGALARRRRA